MKLKASPPSIFNAPLSYACVEFAMPVLISRFQAQQHAKPKSQRIDEVQGWTITYDPDTQFFRATDKDGFTVHIPAGNVTSAVPKG